MSLCHKILEQKDHHSSAQQTCANVTQTGTKEGFVKAINISLSMSASVNSVYSEIAFPPRRLVKYVKSIVT